MTEQKWVNSKHFYKCLIELNGQVRLPKEQLGITKSLRNSVHCPQDMAVYLIQQINVGPTDKIGHLVSVSE